MSDIATLEELEEYNFLQANRIKMLEAEIERLRAAIKKHGKHERACDYMHYPFRKCNCWLAQTGAEAAQQPAQQGTLADKMRDKRGWLGGEYD